MARPLGVGIVGVEPGRSWASLTHVPALRSMPDRFSIVGVANRSAESSRRAAQALGVPDAFASVADLVASDSVDVVAVTVKVPEHFAIVQAALARGKHVYCEWPLGNGLDEARSLAAMAREAGVHAVVGMQALASPAVGVVREMVAGGFVGDVLSTTLVGTGMNWGPTIEQANAYTLDSANGANMLSIPVGHTLAALLAVLGKVETVGAVLATRRPAVQIVDTGQTATMTAPDQVLVAGTLASGAPLSLHYRGGMPHGTGLLWEINGTAGDIQIRAAGGHSQFLDLEVFAAAAGEPALQPVAVDGTSPGEPFVGNVARLYAMLADDIAQGTRTAPDFDAAVAVHQVVSAIEQAAASGQVTRVSQA